jgi:hypothetical protein
MSPIADDQEYGLTPEARAVAIARKFSAQDAVRVHALLASIEASSGELLGAIVFLARPGRVDDIERLVDSARDERAAILDAATVKDERG